MTSQAPVLAGRLTCPAWPRCGCGTQSGPHTCEWRAECHRRYRELGIDPLNPDPDGSDHRLMDAIDAAVTREFAPDHDI